LSLRPTGCSRCCCPINPGRRSAWEAASPFWRPPRPPPHESRLYPPFMKISRAGHRKHCVFRRAGKSTLAALPPIVTPQIGLKRRPPDPEDAFLKSGSFTLREGADMDRPQPLQVPRYHCHRPLPISPAARAEHRRTSHAPPSNSRPESRPRRFVACCLEVPSSSTPPGDSRYRTSWSTWCSCSDGGAVDAHFRPRSTRPDHSGLSLVFPLRDCFMQQVANSSMGGGRRVGGRPPPVAHPDLDATRTPRRLSSTGSVIACAWRIHVTAYSWCSRSRARRLYALMGGRGLHPCRGRRSTPTPIFRRRGWPTGS